MPEHGQPSQRSSATLHHKATATPTRVKASAAGTFWTRLSAVDFINSSLMLAALLLMCFLPFLMVLSAAAGRDVRRSIIIRLGLNHQAAAAVDGLISSGQTAVTTISLLGLAWLVFGAFGISATLQSWYRKAYDEPPSQGTAKQLAAQVFWLAGFLAYLTVQVLIGRHVGSFGAHVLIFVTQFGCAVAFWTISPYLLLLGKIAWRAALPGGIATGLCLTGLSIFSALVLSSTIVSGNENYGPVGVVTALLSYLIGFGVCIHLGAVFGRIWNEHHESSNAVPGG